MARCKNVSREDDGVVLVVHDMDHEMGRAWRRQQARTCVCLLLLRPSQPRSLCWFLLLPATSLRISDQPSPTPTTPEWLASGFLADVCLSKLKTVSFSTLFCICIHRSLARLGACISSISLATPESSSHQYTFVDRPP